MTKEDKWWNANTRKTFEPASWDC